MNELELTITENDDGWLGDWSLNGQSVGDAVTVAPSVIGPFEGLTKRLDEVFGRTDHEGFGRLALFPQAMLAGLGNELHSIWCKDIWPGIADQIQNQPTRLMVKTDCQTALNLPWELLPSGASGETDFLGCESSWLVYRSSKEFDDGETAELRAGPLRVLFLTAAPIDQQQLDYEKEEEAVLNATATLRDVVVHIGELGTLEELHRLVAQIRPHVVHLSGHGTVDKDGVGRFCFEDDDGKTDAQPASAIATSDFHKHGVQCVFLNACKSGQAAVAGLCQQFVAAHVPLAIGWGASVADDRATVFAKVFYEKLMAGEPIPTAMALARLTLQEQGVHKNALQDGQDGQDATFILPRLYCSTPMGQIVDPDKPSDTYEGPRTEYQRIGGGVEGLREGFIGRRREQQKLIPPLRRGEFNVAILHGIGGQGKSTLATRVVNRLQDRGKLLVVAEKALGTKTEPVQRTAQQFALSLLNKLSEVAEFHLQGAASNRMLQILSNNESSVGRRLCAAVACLNELPILLVLDNFEDVMVDETREIADEGLRDFYGRLMNDLTGSTKLLVTTRYIPANTPENSSYVRIVPTLDDFQSHDYLKFLRRDAQVESRIRDGSLPIKLVREMYQYVGGTPRFLTEVRKVLRTAKPTDLLDELKSGTGEIDEKRRAYIDTIFGPRLIGLVDESARSIVCAMALSDVPLPADAITGLVDIDSNDVDNATSQLVNFGLVQEYVDRDHPTLYLPPGLLRPWLVQQLDPQSTKSVHGSLAAFWRTVYEEDLEQKLRIPFVIGLEQCRHHARHADDQDQFKWSTLQLVSMLYRYGQWTQARQQIFEISDHQTDANCVHWLGTFDLMQGDYPAARENFRRTLEIKQAIGDRAGEAATWHGLASIDLNEGDYPAARENFRRSLEIKQAIGDRAGEAATWHGLANIDLREGDYPAARENFRRSLEIEQEIGNRAGEAATWAQLANIDLREGDYPAARENFRRSLEMLQVIGDRAGEAAAWHGLASIDLEKGDYPAARDNFRRALEMRQEIGDRAGEANTWAQIGVIAFKNARYKPASRCLAIAYFLASSVGTSDVQLIGENLKVALSKAEIPEDQLERFIQETAEQYQQDQGQAILKSAFEGL